MPARPSTPELVSEILQRREEPYRGILLHVGHAVGFQRAREILLQLQSQEEAIPAEILIHQECTPDERQRRLAVALHDMHGNKLHPLK
jgi:hypothetical protein